MSNDQPLDVVVRLRDSQQMWRLSSRGKLAGEAADEIMKLRAELWVIAELIWTNASRETAKHWATEIMVSIRGKPGDPDAVRITTNARP